MSKRVLRANIGDGIGWTLELSDNARLIDSSFARMTTATCIRESRRLVCEYCGCISEKESGTCEHCGAPLVMAEW